MSTCRASDDEKEHDRKQSKTDDRVKALEATLKMAAQEELQKELESHSRYEFLGFDAFMPLFVEKDNMPMNQSFKSTHFSQLINEIFMTSAISKEWETAAAVVMTRAVHKEMDDKLLECVKNQDISAVADVIEERCTERYEQILERVTDNWSDYE